LYEKVNSSADNVLQDTGILMIIADVMIVRSTGEQLPNTGYLRDDFAGNGFSVLVLLL
jgi:hypothetical protein